MRATALVTTVLISGALAGAAFGVATHLLAIPYIEAATLAEARAMAGAGAGAGFWEGYAEYRGWQGAGAMVAAVVLGCAFASLYGIVYALCGRRLPLGGGWIGAYALAGAMWLALYAVPAIKYPPALPGDGGAETLGLRVALHGAILVISAGSALALHRAAAGRRAAGRAACAACWAGVVIAAIALLPPGPDAPSSGPDELAGFRAASAAAVAAYWAALPAAFVPLARRLGAAAPRAGR